MVSLTFYLLLESRNEAEVTLKFDYKSIEPQRNEFYPSSAITYLVPINQSKNFLILHKIDPSKEFTPQSDINIDLSIYWSKDSYYPRQ